MKADGLISKGAVSVIVAVHNKIGTIERVLNSILTQECTHGTIELVVVDDGSADGSREYLREQSTSHSFTLVELDNAKPSASAVRNCGLFHCTGQWCLFLDADVILRQGTLEHLGNLAREPKEVILLPTYGSSASLGLWPLLADLPDDSADDIALQYLVDPRSSYAGGPDRRLDHLAAPWVFCWTTAVFMETALARSVGGFDETLIGKGSEDIEFGFRLSAAGARFRLAHCSVVHLPHYRERTNEEHLDRLHETRILAKHPLLDMEMLCAFDALNANAALAFSRDLPANNIDWSGVSQWHRPPGELLLFFAQSPTLSSVLSPSIRLDHKVDRATGNCLPLLGFALPFETSQFELAVVPDLRQVLPESLMCRLFQEACRVARRVFYLRAVVTHDAPCTTTEMQVRCFDRPYWERSIYVSRSYHDWKGTVVTRVGSGSNAVTVVEVERQR